MKLNRRPVPRRRIMRTVDEAAVRRAFATRDEDMLNTALGEPPADGGVTELDDVQPDDVDGGATHNITVNIHGAAAPGAPPSVDTANDSTTTLDQPPAPAAGPDNQPMPAWAQALTARLDALEASVAQMMGGDGDGDEIVPGEGDGDGDEPPPSDDTPPPADDEKRPTGDSAALKAVFQDTLARAELLAPGIKLPTLDGAASAKQTNDSLCAFRRTVLAKAAGDTAINTLIGPLVEGRDLNRMTCDSITTTFVAASEMVRNNNNRAVTRQIATRHTTGEGASAAMTPAQINAINRAKYGYA